MSEEKPRSQETEEERKERLIKQEEIDSRSVYVGNVDYQSSPEQLEEFFHVVGIIERVTILFDRFTGLPKGYAYIEFEKAESVPKAIEDLHGKAFRGREIRVTAKRTNLPGFRRGNGFRGRGRGGFRGRGGRGGFRGGRGRGRGGRGGFSSREAEGDNEEGEPEEAETQEVAVEEVDIYDKI
ncbi:Pabp2 Polyadenylate-binding protein 2 [Candida maltosa Xu316]